MPSAGVRERERERDRTTRETLGWGPGTIGPVYDSGAAGLRTRTLTQTRYGAMPGKQTYIVTIL